MSVTRTNVEFAKRIFSDRVGNAYVYGGNWNPFNLKVGTDCSGLVVDICDAVRNGTAMAWTRHGMSTESWRPIEVGQTGTIFNTVCVNHPNDFPSDAAVKIALHHGPGGGANSHMWCEVEGIRMESNGSDGCVTGDRAMSVYDTSYANDWHYLPGPIVGAGTPPPPPPVLSRADRYALLIIAEGRRRGITVRGIQIALATGLVESNLKIYANERVPESMSIPHDDVGSDAYSVGIFQQQVRDTGNGWWWGDAATCMDPTSSAGLFYDRLARLAYNGPNSPGSYAQAVQSSAFPDRYDQRFAEAVALYNRLATTPPGDDELSAEAERMIRELHGATFNAIPSQSIYASPGEGAKWRLHELIKNDDAMIHQIDVEKQAKAGDLNELARVVIVARGQGVKRDKWAVERAQRVLAEIESTNPEILQRYLVQRGSL